MPTFRRIRHTIAAILLVLYLPGCYTWKPAKVSPEQLFADKTMDKVRVTTVEGQTLELANAYIVGDSLYGYQPARTPVDGDSTQTTLMSAIALAGITRVEVQKMSPLGVAIISVVVVGLTAGFVVLVADELEDALALPGTK